MEIQAKKKSNLRKNRLGYYMLIPALVVILAIQIYPFLEGLRMSLTNYNLLRPNAEKFVGLENFITILKGDKDFYSALRFSFIYSLSIVVFSYIFGLLLALLLNQKLKARGLFRAIILLPWVVSPMVMASNWLWLLNDQFGIINHFLMNIGVISEPILFFTTKNMARFSVIMVGIWKNLPFMTVTLLAGLQSISADMYEASRIDGASNVKSFFYITLPSLHSVTKVSVTLLMIWAFNGFENIFLLTEGGPTGFTTVLPIYSYNMAFFRSKMGYASALSILMMVLMVVLCVIYQWMNRQSEGEG